MFRRHHESVWTGILGGALGGLAASFAMGFFQVGWGKLTGSQEAQKAEDSTAKAAEAISKTVFDHPLEPAEKKVAAPAVHYAFGTSMGALYGAAASAASPVAAAGGAPFGAALWLGAHVTAVPALGLSESPAQKPLTDEVGEFISHLLYGLITDGVRRAVLAGVRGRF